MCKGIRRLTLFVRLLWLQRPNLLRLHLGTRTLNLEPTGPNLTRPRILGMDSTMRATRVGYGPHSGSRLASERVRTSLS